eukprot:CAMPEP_0175589448 /NCGR_PEP_ID=MMETSP0096-20121207/51818_1 /TAXON_ID=311494 /ORGANISM="Alexandrium monilatum, Strain CCMP3105" /LENGTH=43 /DNA_ID= /DNA_START= /DNA_END= /DNA_ORIENTATION=
MRACKPLRACGGLRNQVPHAQPRSRSAGPNLQKFAARRQQALS